MTRNLISRELGLIVGDVEVEGLTSRCVTL